MCCGETKPTSRKCEPASMGNWCLESLSWAPIHLRMSRVQRSSFCVKCGAICSFNHSTCICSELWASASACIHTQTHTHTQASVAGGKDLDWASDYRALMFLPCAPALSETHMHAHRDTQRHTERHRDTHRQTHTHTHTHTSAPTQIRQYIQKYCQLLVLSLMICTG